MNSHKKQHTIPRSYLAAWIEPVTPTGQTAAIWRISKDRSCKRRKSPEKSFTETDRYTIFGAGGKRELAVEHWLATIENDFLNVLKSIRRMEQLGPIQRAKLSIFTAAMLGRSKKQGDYWKEQWDQNTEKIRQMEDPQSPGVLPLSQQMRLANVDSHAHLVVGTINAGAPVLSGMNITILTTDDPDGFITSDAPAVMYNPSAYTMPPFYRSPGLLQTDIEVSLPLTPLHLALFTHRPSDDLYLQVSPRVVDEVNRTTFFHCDEDFVSWKGTTREAWFEERAAPPDAWEKIAESNSI